MQYSTAYKYNIRMLPMFEPGSPWRYSTSHAKQNFAHGRRKSFRCPTIPVAVHQGNTESGSVTGVLGLRGRGRNEGRRVIAWRTRKRRHVDPCAIYCCIVDMAHSYGSNLRIHCGEYLSSFSGFIVPYSIVVSCIKANFRREHWWVVTCYMCYSQLPLSFLPIWIPWNIN
jgi:hypothetical protein